MKSQPRANVLFQRLVNRGDLLEQCRHRVERQHRARIAHPLLGLGVALDEQCVDAGRSRRAGEERRVAFAPRFVTNSADATAVRINPMATVRIRV